MTIINCSLNCIHQQEGLCGRDSANYDTISGSPECVFFKDKSTSSGSSKANEKELLKNG